METTLNVQSQEYMETMARLMSEALESPEGMRALAAAISEPIEQEISRKEISSLLLTRHTLPKGERPLYQKKPKVRAYWISTEGEAREQEVGKDEVEFPTHRIHSTPMVDVSVLKHGNIGTLMDIQTSAADEIRKEIDKRTLYTIISQPMHRYEFVLGKYLGLMALLAVVVAGAGIYAVAGQILGAFRLADIKAGLRRGR